ncbi:MAG TPA: lysylphosphatidylglycerol synthase domain-containing protein [Solirubrobacteraceae bacterium]|nr:lysylphosphatidylglycerol synthase domain-containing protein [Solirubrobacteraceae bacterium]
MDAPRTLRRKCWLSLAGTVVVVGLVGLVLGGRRHEFATALTSTPVSLLAAAVALQVIALLARSEAWLISLRAAGARVDRRILFRAAGAGSLAAVINGSLGVAARIASLRRAAPGSTPKLPALLTAEVPIIAVEIALAAIFSFTLVVPLGIPWWVPVIAVTLAGAAMFGLRRLSDARRTGLCAGLAVMRSPSGGRLIAFTLLAVCTQVLRSWMMLHAIGEDVSMLDAMALLIAMFTLGQLPIGPSTGPAAAMLILGAHGVASSAAAGVLLAVSGMLGSLLFASWALLDRVISARVARTAREVTGSAVAAVPGPALPAAAG